MSNGPPESEFEPPTGNAAELLARFDSILAGEASDGDTSFSAVDGSLHELCDFLVLLETAWPRKPNVRDAVTEAFECEGRSSRCLGRFRLIREIGRGGCGVVFLAEDPHSEKLVALKVPNPAAMASRESKRRFLREARATASLNHPSIVAVYEAGEVGPVCYIASAYAEGTNLAAWLATQKRPVSSRLAATIVCQLAEAVQHAHSRGVLHRDIKPSNVLLESLPKGQSSTAPPLEPFSYLPKLCDFGLAKVIVAEGDSLTTRHGEVIGTPDYMAPEAASPALGPTTPAVDIYSLGVLLYELLTREVPHRGANDLETMRRITEDSAASPRRLRGDVDRDLAAVCLKCLEKHAGDRYPSAKALSDDLQRYLAKRPVRARPVPPLIRIRRWAMRRPALAALSVALFVTLVCGFVGVIWQWRRAEANLAIARAERHRAEQHWVEENRLVSELFRSGDHSAPDSRPLLRSQVRKRLAARYQAIIDGQGNVSYSPAEVATASTKYALLTSSRNSQQRLNVLLRGITAWRELARQEPGDRMVALGLADAELDAAFVYLSQDDLVRATKFAECAYRSFGRIPSEPTEFDEERFRLGIILRLIADAHLKRSSTSGELAATATCYHRAIDYWRRGLRVRAVNPDYERELADCLARLSDCEERRRRFASAISMRQERIELNSRAIERTPEQMQAHLKLAQDYHQLSELFKKSDQIDSARQALEQCGLVVRRAAELDTNQLAGDQAAHAAMTLGHIYDTLGNTAQAASEFEKAAASYADLVRKHPEVFAYRREHSEGVFWTARLHGDLADPRAKDLYERALQIAAEIAAAPQATYHDRTHLQRCHIVYARYLAQAGHAEQARQHYLKSAEMIRGFLANAPDEPIWVSSLAECESALAAHK
jgi:serine/threonine protein kinase